MAISTFFSGPHFSNRYCPYLRKFEQGFIIPDNLDGTADVVDPPPNNEPTWERQMLHDYQHFLPLRDIADAIWQGYAIVGSNGSAANDNGTYGFSILTNILDGPPTVALKCGGYLPTLADYIDMDSHHPEGAGLYAALCFVHLLLLDHPRGPLTRTISRLHFVLDNKSVAIDDLEWTFNNDISVYTYLKADYDIL
jgi:hypothetical protein